MKTELSKLHIEDLLKQLERVQVVHAKVKELLQKKNGKSIREILESAKSMVEPNPESLH